MITPPQLEGWDRWTGNDPFEDSTGPFFMKLDPENGKHLSAFLCQDRHMNGGGFMHGGMLMSFADYALFVIAHDELREQHSVTLSCQTDFVSGAAPIGKIVYADGEVIKATRSLVFVRGQTYVDDTVLTTFTGILKKTKPREQS
ncbi:MAG: PaaI family thioesterase [Parvibaculales bacterium]